MYQNIYTNNQLYSQDYIYEGAQPYCIHQSHNLQYPPGLSNQYDYPQNPYLPGYNDAFISTNFDRIEIKYSLYIRSLSTIKLLYYFVTQHNGQLSYMRIYDGYNVDIVFYNKKDSDFIYKQLNNTTLNNELLKFYYDDSFSRNVPTLPAFSGLSKNKPPNGIHLINSMNGNIPLNQNPSNSMNSLPINANIGMLNQSNGQNNQSISLNHPNINHVNTNMGHNNPNSSHNINHSGLNSPINTHNSDDRNNMYYQHVNSPQPISPNDEPPFQSNTSANQSNQVPIDIPLPPTTNTHLQPSIVSLCSSISSMTITPHLNFGIQPITKSTSLNSPIVITSNGVNDNLYMKFNYTNNGFKNNIKGSKIGGNGMRNKTIVDNNNNSSANSVNNSKKLSDTPNTSINLSISASGRIRSPHTDADNSVYQIDVIKIKNKQDLRTTLMIKNIPNKYTQNMVLYEINLNHHKKYDFFYLPIDFKNKCNVGYAFINFINPYDVLLFYNEFNNRKWNKFNSDKICEVRYGRIQGKSSLINHFKNSSVMVVDEQFRPLLFFSTGPSKGEPEEFPE